MGSEDNLYRDFDLSRLVDLERLLPPRPGLDDAVARDDSDFAAEVSVVDEAVPRPLARLASLSDALISASVSTETSARRGSPDQSDRSGRSSSPNIVDDAGKAHDEALGSADVAALSDWVAKPSNRDGGVGQPSGDGPDDADGPSEPVDAASAPIVDDAQRSAAEPAAAAARERVRAPRSAALDSLPRRSSEHEMFQPDPARFDPSPPTPSEPGPSEPRSSGPGSSRLGSTQSGPTQARLPRPRSTSGTLTPRSSAPRSTVSRSSSRASGHETHTRERRARRGDPAGRVDELDRRGDGDVAIEVRPTNTSARRPGGDGRPATASVPRNRLGYQPGLDGLRAISVIAVILYHGGFSWIHGGFLGVEVFFVVSGYLITILLIEENESTGRIDLTKFWIRRGRRLLPALFAMLAVITGWVLTVGTHAQKADLRRNLPWSIFYVANWGQILGEVPYFQSGDPPLLRHLWSLAVEEQWYVVWPLVFVGLSRMRRPGRTVQVLLAAVALVMLAMLYVQNGSVVDDPVNVNYLSTLTRSGGLLLGAAGAFFWRPWRSSAALRVAGGRFDVVFGVALAGLIISFVTADLTSAVMYPWGLTLVSALSLACVLAVVHPASRVARALTSSPALVDIGKRSYGLYLWHWPIFVLAGATEGSWTRFGLAIVLAVVASEVCYRYVEQPIRNGTLSQGWLGTPNGRAFAGIAVVAVFAATVMSFRAVEPFDAAVGDQDVAFGLAPTTAPSAAVPVNSAAEPVVVLPKVLIVGDSQGHSLVVNQPDGVESVIDVSDATVDGCSVYDNGILTSTQGFTLDTAGCAGWEQKWATTAQTETPDVALVVLGAWDSLDVVTPERWYPFGSAERDALFVDGLNKGLDAMSASVGSIALLEVPCMRPIAVEGAYTPPLPERSDDTRVARINGLLQQVATSRPDTTFVEGPDEWCTDPAIADNPAYRWDGVHVYQQGANLVFEKTVPTLLALADAGDAANTSTPAATTATTNGAVGAATS